MRPQKQLRKEEKLKAKKKRKANDKGENKRYTHLNAEFQRRTKRDKTTVLSDQCKAIEENNRKTRDLFKKTRDTKGMFRAKMGAIKDRKNMHLRRRGY